jgi:heat shock protein HtpX
MATLYTHAESNTRKTWILMSFFFILIIVLGYLFSYYLKAPFVLLIAIIFSVFTSFGSYWYSDKIVIAMTKAHPIQKEQNPELYRLVENLCIAAGLPLPKIYILDEAQPNAFATGRDANHAVIAVTRGLLEKMEKVELEGVIAHELSHIGNKDMLLQTVVVVLAGTIALLANLFFRISRFGGLRGGRRDKGNIIFLAILIITVILAPIAATLIKLAISRKREFLADASGALLTRYPEGLARALEKISADSNPLKVANSSTAHLFISAPFRGEEKQSWFANLLRTHPLTIDRVKALRNLRI